MQDGDVGGKEKELQGASRGEESRGFSRWDGVVLLIGQVRFH